MTRRARGVTLEAGRYYFVKRVPKTLEGKVLGENGKPLKRVRFALRTDSLTVANTKAAKVAEQIEAEWAALEAGDGKSARAHYLAARRLAEARGVPYVPMKDLVDGNLEDLVSRVLSLAQADGGLASKATVEAVLGAVPETLPRLSEILPEFFELTRTRHVRKSEAQLKTWKNSRERAVRTWVEVTGDPPLNHITRADALKFRKYWSDRILAEKMAGDVANKDLSHLGNIWRVWCEAHSVDLPSPFSGLKLEGHPTVKRPPFTADWITGHIMAPGALDRLNEEARDFLLVMVNTGLRPHEAIDAPMEDWHLDHNIPHLAIAAHGRELKTAHTARDLPLVGVSLEAARRIVARGPSRYFQKSGAWSALVGKYLRNNNLIEVAGQTPYSLRHSVEDRLLAAGVDDRVRADILGHRYERPRYGTGGALVARLDALRKIAL